MLGRPAPTGGESMETLGVRVLELLAARTRLPRTLFLCVMLLAGMTTLSACGEPAASTCADCLDGCCANGVCVLQAEQNNERCGSAGSQCESCASRGQICNSATRSCQAAIGSGAVPAADCGGRCDLTTQRCEAVANSTQGACVPIAQQPTQLLCPQAGQCKDPVSGACIFSGQACSGGAICANGLCANQVQNPLTTGCNACTAAGSALAQTQCCDTQNQRCVFGNSPQACGHGSTCRICTGGETCVNGVCTNALSACSAANCTGCCTADGVCRALGEIRTDGVNDQQCGWGGAQCQPCGYQRSCDKKAGTCGAASRKWRVCLTEIVVAGDFNEFCAESIFGQVGLNRSPKFAPTIRVASKSAGVNDGSWIIDAGFHGALITKPNTYSAQISGVCIDDLTTEQIRDGAISVSATEVRCGDEGAGGCTARPITSALNHNRTTGIIIDRLDCNGGMQQASIQFQPQ